MSTELKSSNPEITLTRFYGGEHRGTCLHVSGVGVKRGYITGVSLRRDQAIKLAQDLLTFVKENDNDRDLVALAKALAQAQQAREAVALAQEALARA